MNVGGESQSSGDAIGEGGVCNLGSEDVVEWDKEASRMEDFFDCSFVQDCLDEGALPDSSGSQ